MQLSDIQSGISSLFKYCSLKDMHHFYCAFSTPHVNIGVSFVNTLTCMCCTSARLVLKCLECGIHISARTFQHKSCWCIVDVGVFMVYLSIDLLNLSLLCVGTMNVTGMPLEGLDNSDDEFQVLEGMNVGIPECEGLSRRLWNTKCVTLYNEEAVLVGEGTCHSVNSDLVLGATSPLGDIQVAVFVAKTHSKEHLSQERVYSLVAWPIKYVPCCGASL